MRIQIPKQHLATATQRIQGTIADRSLSQVALKAEGQTLTVMAADRVVTVYSSLDAVIEQEGICFVPGKLFSDLVKELPDGSVQLRREGNFIHVETQTTSSFQMKLPIHDEGTWKEPGSLQTNNHADLPTDKVNYLIQQVQFCIAQESPRNYGSVGYLHRPEAGRLRLVGTDGYRLSYGDMELNIDDDFLPTGVCLSKRALVEIQRMCSEGFASIQMAFDQDSTTMSVKVQGYQIFIRLSAVKYPNYQGVLPTANLQFVKAKRPELQSVTRRVLLAADKSRALQLSFSNGSLTLSSKTVGTSESKECLPLAEYKGQDRSLSVNGKFLTDVFTTIPSERVMLQFKGEDDPFIIIPEEEPNACRSMHVLVPIRENA